MTKFLAILGAASVAALLFFSPPARAVERVEVEVGQSPTHGPADAPVTMIEFVDFQ